MNVRPSQTVTNLKETSSPNTVTSQNSINTIMATINDASIKTGYNEHLMLGTSSFEHWSQSMVLINKLVLTFQQSTLCSCKQSHEKLLWLAKGQKPSSWKGNENAPSQISVTRTIIKNPKAHSMNC